MKNAFRVVTTLISVFALLSIVVSSAAAGRPFSDEVSTADGYETWDSDMIDIEKVSETGAGVYVAVLDTGLTANWKDYFPEERIAEELGTGFQQSISFKAGNDACGLGYEVGALRQSSFIGSRGSTHGTHVTSTIIGYFYDSNFDTVGGFSTPPIMVRGIAPDVTIIPVKVLADYQMPARPKCTDPNVDTSAHIEVFGTDAMVAAGIRYVGDLAAAGYRPMVINMSLGGGALEDVEKEALDYAIAQGVIVVASAGNEGEFGIGFPGAYPPVISAGSVGWTGEWLFPGDGPRYRMWWLKDDGALGLPAGSGDVTEDITPANITDTVYLSDFSSREITGIGQELDVLAPGSWVRGPYPGLPGYSHLPWWSKGIGDLYSSNPSNFYYVGGTSMSAPHVSAVSALLLEKDPSLVQAQVEEILRSSAIPMPDTASVEIWDNTAAATVTWDTYCEPWEMACDPVGYGLMQADDALNLLP